MDTPSSDPSPGGNPPSSPLWARVGLLLVSVVLCAGAVELGLRITSSRPVEVCTKGFDQPVTSLFRHLDVAPYLTMWPNVTMMQRYFRVVDGDCVVDLEIPFQTNSQGFRDTEHTLFKPPGIYRIVVLGDSFTVGDGVLAEQAWPRVLQTRLRQRMGQPAARGAESGIEVINTAVMSYGTMDEVVALQRWGLQYRPDAVVVGLYLNDAKPARGPQAAKKERSGERPAKRSTSNVLPTRLYSRPLYLMDWIEALVDVTKTNSETIQFYRDLWSEKNPGMGELRDAIRLLGGLQRDRSLPFLVVVWPWLHQLDESYPFEELHDTVDQLCAQEGLQTLQLLDPMRAVDPEVPLWVHYTDAHPSKELHALAADLVAERLVQDARFGLTGNVGSR